MGKFLNIVLLNGDEVVVERDGKPVARIVPVTDAGSVPSGRLDLRRMRGLGSEVWRGVDVDRYVGGERESWT